MSQGKRVPAEIKEQILHRIRTEGISAAQAAKEHGISAPTIYTWLSKAVDVPANILQINKLRRVNSLNLLQPAIFPHNPATSMGEHFPLPLGSTTKSMRARPTSPYVTFARQPMENWSMANLC